MTRFSALSLAVKLAGLVALPMASLACGQVVMPGNDPAAGGAGRSLPAERRDVNYRGLDLSKVVVWTEAAGGYGTARGFHPVLARSGWKAFIKAVVQPEVDWLRMRSVENPRVLIHNPYGLERDASGKTGEYRFSQRALCAADPRTRYLADGLGEAIRPLVQSGVEVIVYFGSIPNDPALQLLQTPGGVAAFDRMCDEQIEEAVSAGASIAFDASNDLPAESAEWKFIERTAGRAKVYLEPRPHASRGQMFGYPIITQDAFWERSNPEKYPDSRWGARNSELSGEIIRFVQFPDPPAQGKDVGWNDTPANIAARLLAPAIRIQADGHTPTLTTTHLRQMDR
ncbi:MAG TPA: hypothetical protein PLD59_14560 [Tepidisphaeraceae bacterium]|nr:hypothetical protein [Tepidisphaeraceae bacterium]